MIKLKTLPLTLASLVMTFACSLSCSQTSGNVNSNSDNSSGQTANSNATDKETPNVTGQGKIKVSKTPRLDAQQESALKLFLDSDFKGWTIVGMPSAEGCTGGDVCAIHLSKGKANKVVQVIFRLFHREDGSEYWLVTGAQAIDLLKSKIERIKLAAEELAVQDFQENLSIDDCQKLIEDDRDYYDSQDWEPYTPRG